MEQELYEQALLMSQKKFKNYKYSIFLLQKQAIKIQHWFFKTKMRNALIESYK